jgi:hypothetical protein
MIVLGACRSNSNPPANQQRGAANNNTRSAINEADLLEQVDDFATDEGELGQAAWRKLEAYPRPELIDHLSALRDSSSQDKPVKANIAFVLCNLDHDYQLNRAVIVSAFNESIDDADRYERPLDRLIRRGDKELLQVLFAVVPRSDGGLSEVLADTFADQMENSTEAFLTQLATQPKPIRRKVSEYVDFATSDQDKINIKAFLRSIPKSSPLASLAKEMLSDLSQVKID